jgi:hypothetical protein
MCSQVQKVLKSSARWLWPRVGSLWRQRSTTEQRVQPGTESSQIIRQMALAKSRFLVAAPVNYRAGHAARYRKFSNHPPDGFGHKSFIVAAPVNYRAARAAGDRKFSNHPPDGSDPPPLKKSILSLSYSNIKKLRKRHV